MKIALYIEDGLEQIVLTPESKTETGILDKLHDGTRDMSIKRGEFYACRGGWTRWKKQYHSPYGSDEANDVSTMIVLSRKPEVALASGEASGLHDDRSALDTGDAGSVNP